MSYRGHGRGGRGGGRRGSYIQSAPVVLFPNITLPEKGTLSQEDKILINTKIKLQHYWNASPYYIEAPFEKSQSVDIQRFSDKGKTKRSRRRENLSEHLKCSSFPIELHDELLQKRGPKRTRAPKKARSTVGGLEKLDMFEKLEQEGQNKEASDKPKKEGDEEEDAEEEDDEEDAEYSDDGDYNQTEYFDDDEDDYNDGLGSIMTMNPCFNCHSALLNKTVEVFKQEMRL